MLITLNNNDDLCRERNCPKNASRVFWLTGAQLAAAHETQYYAQAAEVAWATSNGAAMTMTNVS